jgi:rhodanese-related sulfurtransferase
LTFHSWEPSVFSREDVPTVEVTALPEGAYLVDVREHDEWTAGHAPGAVHIPLGEVVARAAEISAADGSVYVVCRAGGRSAQAVGFLVGNGVEAVNVAGGMQAWSAAGRPMVSESGDAPSVI